MYTVLFFYCQYSFLSCSSLLLATVTEMLVTVQLTTTPITTITDAV